MTADKMVIFLAQNMTKWQIKNLLGVSWRTVRMWERGVVIPNPENMVKLKQMYSEKGGG